jgi:hypothetical protein
MSSLLENEVKELAQATQEAWSQYLQRRVMRLLLGTCEI